MEKGRACSENQYAFVLNRFISGDDEALSIIYYDFFDSMLNFGLRYSGNREVVEDAIQNLFLDLLKNRKKLRNVANIRFYLLKSLRYQILKEQKMISRLVSEQEIDPSFQIVYSAEDSIIAEERIQDRKKFVTNILKNLTSRQQETLYLKFNCGFSYDQIAELMQVDSASVRKTVYRIIKTIRESLHPQATDNPFILLSILQNTNFQ